MLSPDNAGNGISIAVPSAASEGLKTRILSLPYVVYQLGFKCILDKSGWEGIYKFNPVTSNTTKIPFTFDKSKRLWLLHYSTGKTASSACQCALDKTSEHISTIWENSTEQCKIAQLEQARADSRAGAGWSRSRSGGQGATRGVGSIRSPRSAFSPVT